MNYASVCSGIEAATVAWHPLGWRPVLFAEIDKFPSRVLAHHYPEVPNVGDFTKIEKDQSRPIDLLVGGTPCQDFSVAGLRAGLDGERGQLTVEFAQLAGRLRPRWLVWENVPGVLSSDGGRAFGMFIGLLGQLGYGVAYRILDAQHLGVPQRRRRVFVVGHLGDWRRAAAVLFERQSLSGDNPPRRETRQDSAYDVAPCIGASGRGFERTGDSRGQDCLICSTGDTSHCLNGGGMGRQDFESETLITHSLRGGGFDASEDGTGRNGFGIGDQSPTLRSMGHTGSHQNGGDQVAVAINLRGRDGGSMPELSDVASLRAASRGSSRSYVSAHMAVRRLTPRECERLQGFPDDYTLIDAKTPDGPRYKALANSMAVPVMRWIGQRIAMVDVL